MGTEIESPSLRWFLGAVREQLPSVRVSQMPLDCMAYARDASPEAFLERREGRLPLGPGAVIWPANAHDVSAVIRLAAERSVPLYPFGAGSGVVEGLKPMPRGVVVDLKRLNSVVIDAASGVVHAGAGVIGERLERALNAAGLTAGHFPSSIYISTVGGWVAARSAGQLSSRYGKVEDMVLAVEFVDGMGRHVHARRGMAPDVLRAIVGSEGALGIITKVTLCVHPLASHRVLMGLAAPDMDRGLGFMRAVMQSGVRPAAFRMYDPADTMLAGGIPDASGSPEVQPGCISRAGHEDAFMGGDANGGGKEHLFKLLQHRARAAIRHLLAVGHSNALVRIAVGEGLKKTSWLQFPYRALPPRCLMVLGLEGDPHSTQEALDWSLQLAAKSGINVVGSAPGERWLRRRHAVTYKMPPFLRAGGWADTLEVSAPWSALIPLYHDARRSMLEHAITLAHFSHAYSDGASIYFTVAGGGHGLQDQKRAHQDCVDAAMRAFARHGGALSHHHGVGRQKTAHLYETLGPGALAALQHLKQAMDPQQILNPGVLALGGAET
jgi:alkyldihydroxyacetonephosphate synthase